MNEKQFDEKLYNLSETDLLSKPWTSPGATIPEDILKFDYSFGYNCKKLYNLCMMDENVLVFGSGNLIHFYNVKDRTLDFRRTAGGGGIGCILKNPNPVYKFLTVAENGDTPLVIIYKYPNMEVVSILKNGAIRSYTQMDYSSDGELLATQSGVPDYMLTIWRWKTNSIISKVKSYGNDVLNVKFSLYNPDQLTTCGLGHINFWNMCKTFTGLKIKGGPGRFGKTKINDIYAIFPMPDEKVISGCEWGNMLVWDEGVIKVEVCRKNRKPCHTGPITEIFMDEGEVMTIGMDGYVRIWFWETVELADPPEDDCFVEIEPIYEYRIGSKNHLCELMCLIKRYPNDKSSSKYFAQDGKGGIWICDLDKENIPEPPIQIFHCHDGKIMAIGASPISPHIVTLGEGGRLHLYNYKTRKLLAQKQFVAGGSDLRWIPNSIDPTGSVILAGFDDGVTRLLAVELDSSKGYRFHLLNASKMHTEGITKLEINPKNTILISAAKDKTIFISQLVPSSPFVAIVPIGFIEVPSVAIALNWKNNEVSTILIGCLFGEILEGELQENPTFDSEISYNLKEVVLKKTQFKSVKSEIRHNLKLNEIQKKKEEEIEKKMEAMKRLREQNPGIDINEEAYLVDSDPEEEFEPLFIPKVPNKIIWLQHTKENTIWLSVSGYDAGYIYEYTLDGETENIRNTLISGADDIEIHSYFYIHNYLIFGLQTGHIRVNQVKDDFRDLSEFWQLSMHDNFNGQVSAFCSSYDNQYLFSIGADGNIFSYKWNISSIEPIHPPKPLKFTAPAKAIDIENKNHLSLEQQKQKDEQDRKLKITTERKNKIFDILSEYRAQFKEILRENNALPKSQQYSQKYFEVDSRITKDLLECLDDELQLVREKMAFDVEKVTLARQKVMEYFIDPLEGLPIEVSGIRVDVVARSFRIQRLDEKFEMAKLDLEERFQSEMEKIRISKLFDEIATEEIKPSVEVRESFLQGLTTSKTDIKLGSKMKRLLDNYRSRKNREMQRKLEWEKLEAEKPDPNKNHPDDDRDIEEAHKTIGDYKLKTNLEYQRDEEETVLTKYKELISVREKIFDIRNNFNKELLKLRDDKKDLFDYMTQKRIELNIIHEQIPKNLHKFIPEPKQIDESREYPEQILKSTVAPSTGFEVKDLLVEKVERRRKFILKTEITQEDRYNRLEWQVLGLNPEMQHQQFEEVCLQVEKFPRLSETKSEILFNLGKQKELTPWELELKYLKVVDKVFEQEQILNEVEDCVRNFDTKLKEIFEKRLLVEVDAKFLECYLLTLNQELWILKDFEQIETKLIQKFDKTFEKHNEIQNEVTKLNTAIENHKKNIEKMQEAQKTVQQQFALSVKGNKFGDFLQKVFKKKYKLPKMNKTDDSDDSSISSISFTTDNDDNDDFDSLDSFQMSTLRIDENICPPGCDRNLYDQTFKMRSERHLLEQNMHTEQRSIDELKRKLDQTNVKMMEIENVLDIRRTELIEFKREKQMKLNNVETVVVLRMDQIQHFKTREELRDISNTLLFRTDNILKLHTRVGQLAEETLEAKRRHKVNIVHLTRMESDCKYMNKKITDLNEDINSAMIKKFGMKVNLDELEESVLRRCIFNMKTNLEDERKEVEKSIAKEKDVLANIESELIKETRIGTEKLNILTVLQEEKNYLRELLNFQHKLLSRTAFTKHIDFRYDLKRLKDISKQQEEQIEYLEKEIRTLRLKSKPFASGVQDIESSDLTEILPPQENREYEEAVYINVRTSSPQQFDANSTSIEKISQIVEGFLLRTLGDQINDEDMNKYRNQISKYLGYVVSNIDTEKSETVMKSVIENLQQMIPQKFLDFIKPKDIGVLFEEVIAVLNRDEGEINLNEVIASVVKNATEVSKQLKSMNFTQDLVTEILRELIEILPVDEIVDEQLINHIAILLSQKPEVNVRCINLMKLIDDVLRFSKENLIDDVTLSLIKAFGEKLILDLSRLTGVAVKEFPKM